MSNYIDWLCNMIRITNDPLYMISLGILYHNGIEVEKYPEESVYWFEKAACRYRELLCKK